jgi:hypothetical protein
MLHLHQHRAFRALAFLSILLAAGCGTSSADREKANKLIGEANAAVGTANKLSQDAFVKFRSYMNSQTMANFPSNRDQIRGAVQETAGLLDKSISAYRDAANKFEEASKMITHEKFQEYATLKMQVLRKQAESKEVAKELAEVPLDETITTQAALTTKVKEVDARLNALVKETNDIDERAKKIQQDNPDVISKPSQ